MTTFKIEKGIPLPSFDEKSHGVGLPLGDMMIGDSIYVPVEKDRLLVAQRMRYQVVVFRKRKKPDWRFTIRLQETGVRVWRTA
mgnify:FL=1